MINETLEKLKELQDILAEKYQIENELKEIPRSLITKTELVSRLKKSFIEKNTKFEETKQKINDVRIHMQDSERDRETYEAKIVDISTQREYEALVKEIKDSSEKEQTFRKELQREEKVLQEMEQAIEREEMLIREQEEELKAEQEKIEQELAKRREKIQEIDVLEKEITPNMDEEIIFKFKRIIRSKQGKGIVPLHKGVCSGCNMILPLQFVNDVRSGQGINFCPYCSMILFFQEAGDEDILETMVYEDTSSIFGDDEMDDDFDSDEDSESGFGDRDELSDIDEDPEEEEDDEDEEEEEEEDAEEELEDDIDAEIDEVEDDAIEEDGEE
ncbi:MAG: nucleic acid-binding protein [Spirochaetales bacterium]|nr:nucleic acid-binding protein [Spirochaetales bacterium]